MKFIVIGLGNFGSTLASKLTALGHEVIGVDSNMQRVESLKDKVTHAISLDCLDINALSSLPITESDASIVAIGEDVGPSIMTAALLKQLKAKRIIGRALSPIHQTVLEAIGIKEIAHPEEDSAERLARRLDIKGVIESFNIFDNHKVIEAAVPDKYIGKKVEDINIRKEYNLNILTIIRTQDDKNLLGEMHKKSVVVESFSPQTELQKGDSLLIFGKIKDIKHFLQSHSI